MIVLSCHPFFLGEDLFPRISLCISCNDTTIKSKVVIANYIMMHINLMKISNIHREKRIERLVDQLWEIVFIQLEWQGISIMGKRR